ncbi:MAG: hypothetical protein WCJ37_01825 [Syntrophus sp. (in: bacteria)]
MGTEKTDIEKARKEMHGMVDQFRDCDFETFRKGFIDFSKQTIDFNLLLLNELSDGKKELMAMAENALKTCRETNAKDFKIAAKNFKHVDNQLDTFNDTMSRIAAAAVVSLMRSVCVTEHLYKMEVLQGRITETEMMALLPKKTKTFIASTMGMKVKDMEKLVDTYKAAA